MLGCNLLNPNFGALPSCMGHLSYLLLFAVDYHLLTLSKQAPSHVFSHGKHDCLPVQSSLCCCYSEAMQSLLYAYAVITLGHALLTMCLCCHYSGAA